MKSENILEVSLARQIIAGELTFDAKDPPSLNMKGNAPAKAETTN